MIRFALSLIIVLVLVFPSHAARYRALTDLTEPEKATLTQKQIESLMCVADSIKTVTEPIAPKDIQDVMDLVLVFVPSCSYGLNEYLTSIDASASLRDYVNDPDGLKRRGAYIYIRKYAQKKK